MNDFDIQRIETAIWVLQQYEHQVRFIASVNNVTNSKINDTFSTLEIVKEIIEKVRETE